MVFQHLKCLMVICVELPVSTAVYNIPYLALVAGYLSLSCLSSGANSRMLTIHLQFLVAEYLHTAWKQRQFMKNNKLTLWGWTNDYSWFRVQRSENCRSTKVVALNMSIMVCYCTALSWLFRPMVCVCLCVYIQGVSRLVDITAGGDFLGLCDQKSSYKHVSDLDGYKFMTAWNLE